MPKSNLRVIRAARGLSQTDLALRAGVSRVIVSMFENGHVDLTPDDRRKVAAALAVSEAVAFGSPDQLLSGLAEAAAN